MLQTRVIGEVADYPLMATLNNINTHDMVEGCFSCRFFTFHIFIY